MYRVYETKEYIDWFNKQTLKEQAQIQARIVRIINDEYFGVVKKLTQNLAELKWKSGRRIYFSITYEEGTVIILLLGGNKNTQSKDIKKAKSLISTISRGDLK